MSYCGFLISLVAEYDSISLQVILIESSVTICDFGVPMVGGDLRVFLLCHLGPSSFLFTLHFRQNLNNKRITKRVLYILKSCSPAIGGFFFLI